MPREATAEAPNATMPVAQSPVVDDLWFRLRAEEQEYTRRSRRNARVGCLVLLVLAVAFVAAIWQWGLTAP